MSFKGINLFLILNLLFISVFSQDNAIFNAIQDDIEIELTQDSVIVSKQEKNFFVSDWIISFKYGVVKFHGDLTQYHLFPTYQSSVNFHELRSAYSYNILKEINSFFSFEFTFLKGQLAGIRRDKRSEDAVYFNNLDDPYSLYEGQGEKFESNFIEADIISRINLNTVLSYFSDYNIPDRLKIESSIGLGYNVFNTLRTNLFSNNFIYSYGYQEWDGQTGGQTKGSLSFVGGDNKVSETVLVYGLSASYLINKDFDIDLTYEFRQGITDKWDASIMQSEKRNDAFSFISFGIRYNINKIDKNKEWLTPLDKLKSDVAIIQSVNILGLSEDSDNDGVSDVFDKDLTTPLGVAVDGSGIPLDVDMDNVPDYRDGDPFSSRGAIVDNDGIELDSDNDGVPDSQDLELNTKTGVMVNQFGISLNKNSYSSNTSMIYFPSVFFNSGSYTVSVSNKNRLATIAVFLISNPDVEMKVIGSSDAIGNTGSNKELGLDRANAVIDYLYTNYNIDKNRLYAESIGENNSFFGQNQVVNNQEYLDSDMLLEINRRVDFELIF